MATKIGWPRNYFFNRPPDKIIPSDPTDRRAGRLGQARLATRLRCVQQEPTTRATDRAAVEVSIMEADRRSREANGGGRSREAN